MNFITKKLTKGVFQSLPQFHFLVSNVGGPEPVFAEYICAPDKREEQWRRIKAAGADGRLCRVFINQQMHLNFLKKVVA